MNKEELMRLSYKQEYSINDEAKLLHDYIIENITLPNHLKYLTQVDHIPARWWLFSKEYFIMYFEINLYDALRLSKIKTQNTFTVFEQCINMLRMKYKVNLVGSRYHIEILSKIYPN